MVDAEVQSWAINLLCSCSRRSESSCSWPPHHTCAAYRLRSSSSIVAGRGEVWISRTEGSQRTITSSHSIHWKFPQALLPPRQIWVAYLVVWLKLPLFLRNHTLLTPEFLHISVHSSNRVKVPADAKADQKNCPHIPPSPHCVNAALLSLLVSISCQNMTVLHIYWPRNTSCSKCFGNRGNMDFNGTWLYPLAGSYLLQTCKPRDNISSGSLEVGVSGATPASTPHFPDSFFSIEDTVSLKGVALMPIYCISDNSTLLFHRVASNLVLSHAFRWLLLFFIISAPSGWWWCSVW